MADTVIRVENLGKKYRIGQQPQYHSLRDSIARGFTAPARWLGAALSGKRRAGGPMAPGGPGAGTIWALKDVSFDIERGEVVGVIGRNGAGKSTLLKVLSRITEPTTGEIDIHGRVGSLLEVGTGFHAELTGRENIYLNGAILGMKRAEIARKFDAIVAFSEIETFLDTPVKHYSSGMYMRLAFSVAAHLEPEILVVDEVLAVGDALFQKKCLGKMEEVGHTGRTVLFVSHNMAALESLCTSCLLFRDGQLVRQGKTREVIDSYQEGLHERRATAADDQAHFSPDGQIGIDRLEAELLPNGSGGLDLRVRFRLIGTRPHKNVGAGIALSTSMGTCVSRIAPVVTNFVIDAVEREAVCTFTCPAITSYLAGGDYLIDVWLSRPRVEYLLFLKDVLQVCIPPADVFGAGVYFEQQRYGIVPLPFRFAVEK
jgi:lipopolysaccharide transport system ATP-binding protein